MNIKKWFPTLLTIGLTAITAFVPGAQHFWSNHPEASALVAGVYAVAKGLLPSPVVPDKGDQ